MGEKYVLTRSMALYQVTQAEPQHLNNVIDERAGAKDVPTKAIQSEVCKGN
jgi:hypothetical protein